MSHCKPKAPYLPSCLCYFWLVLRENCGFKVSKPYAPEVRHICQKSNGNPENSCKHLVLQRDNFFHRLKLQSLRPTQASCCSVLFLVKTSWWKSLRGTIRRSQVWVIKKQPDGCRFCPTSLFCHFWELFTAVCTCCVSSKIQSVKEGTDDVRLCNGSHGVAKSGWLYSSELCDTAYQETFFTLAGSKFTECSLL